MNTAQWFYSDTLQTYGPVPVHQLTAMIQGGQLTAAHFVMPEGGGGWQTVGSSPFAAYLPFKAPSTPAAAPPAAQPVTPSKPGAPSARAPGKPQSRPAAVPQPAAKKTGLPIGFMAVAVIALAGAGWWLTRPTPILERTNTTRIEGEPKMVLKAAPVSTQPSQAEKSPSTAIPLPASPVEIRPTKRNGKSAAIKFVNQLSVDVEIQFVNSNGKLSSYGKIKAGTTRNQQTFGGHVWVITTLDGQKLGLVEGEDTESTVIIDSKGVHQISSPKTNAIAVPQPPASSSDLRPSREDGDPARLRFTNKLNEDVKIQFVDSHGKLTKSRNIKAGRTTNPRSNIGYVWLITAKNGTRLGIVQCTTERSTVVIDTQGVQVQTDAVPTHESLQLLPLVQFAGTNIGDAVAVLRQRAAESGLKVQIELDPRVDPKAGSINFDARVAPISEILGLCAYHAGARMEHHDSSFRIVPR